MQVKALVACVNLAVFILGCWEARLASENVPSVETSPGETQGYAFTVFCAIINITGAVFLTYLLCNDEKADKDAPSGCLQCGLFVWTCVLFAGIFNHDIRTGPFQNVVIAQFFLSLSSIGFLCCLGAVGACVVATEEKAPDVYLQV
jgi:hypothetical protein